MSRVGKLDRRALALVLDALLLAALLLLLAPRLTGLPVHEWLGLSLGAPLVVHLLLSWRWIATQTAKMFRRNTVRARINFTLNLALFALIVVDLVSGAVISEVALRSLGVATLNDAAWRALHNRSLNWLVLVAGMHLAMNWRPAMVALRRVGATGWHAGDAGASRAPGTRLRMWLRLLVRVGALALAGAAVAAGVYAWLGPPSAARVYRQDEIARFAGRPLIGVRQLVLEALLLGFVAWVARRWLRVRL